jgi:hypothetical protein
MNLKKQNGARRSDVAESRRPGGSNVMRLQTIGYFAGARTTQSVSLSAILNGGEGGGIRRAHVFLKSPA